jgi:hypothetical protein
VHGAAADVHDQRGAILGEAEPVSEGGRHRLVDEANATHTEASQDRLHFGSIGLECGHRGGHDDVPRAPPGGGLDLGQQLTQEGVRGFAGGDGDAADAGQRSQGFGGESGLEGGDERRVHDAVVAIERRPPDQGPPSDEREPLQGRPTSDAVDEGRALDQVDDGRDEPRGFQGLLVRAAAADGGQLHQPRLPDLVVPAGDPRVRGPEVERPAVHGRPL